MLLLLMRHGIAESLPEPSPEPISKPFSDSPYAAKDDFHRALTGEGRDRAHRAALGLHELVRKLDFLASSPKTRARQTAQIVRDVWGKNSPPLTEWSELMEGDFTALLHKLRALSAKDAQIVLLCGHEPHLSRLISKLLTGSPEKMTLELKKAGVCALEIDTETKKTTLLWHLTPKQLRKIGK